VVVRDDAVQTTHVEHEVNAAGRPAPLQFGAGASDKDRLTGIGGAAEGRRNLDV
jgi:hypothetical protein